MAGDALNRVGFLRRASMMPVWLQAAAAILCASSAAQALAQEIAGPMLEERRPQPNLTRWREDWSPLADPALRTEPLDELKYVPIGKHPGDFLSFGVDIRERFEQQGGVSFGAAGDRSDALLLSRVQVHADLRIRGQVRAFVQLEDVRTSGFARPGPADVNHLDLAQALVAYGGRSGDWHYGLRVGRQEINFDLERFVSIREGPNVRQRFDAIWGEVDNGPWSLRAFISQPVQYKRGTFDDDSGSALRFHGLRLERREVGPGNLSAYFAHYERAGARYGAVAGRERREILDLRYFKPAGKLQLDLEAMVQGGEVGTRDIRAWAFGTRARYSLSESGLKPKLGLQFDAASGDRASADRKVGTFNPLFPNGLYFTQAGYTGYSNLIHLKPNLTVTPAHGVSVLAAVGIQWRATTNDAVYTQPTIPVPGTAGQPGRHSGTYGQARVDWQVHRNVRTSAEFVGYAVGDAIRRAGGHDVAYAGVELALAW